jgi:hypothetical protein
LKLVANEKLINLFLYVVIDFFIYTWGTYNRFYHGF